MSYCVNCGVELDASLKNCPLCNTPVINPNELKKITPPSPFPEQRGQVETVHRKDLAVLLTSGYRHLSDYLGLCHSVSHLPKDSRPSVDFTGRHYDRALSLYADMADTLGRMVFTHRHPDCRSGHAPNRSCYAAVPEISDFLSRLSPVFCRGNSPFVRRHRNHFRSAL